MQHQLSTNRRLKRKTVFNCFLIYCFFVLFRLVLARATAAYPHVLIDEKLYYSIARSIANGKGALYLEQPADYTFIVYPLCLVPIYRIFHYPADFYGIIQIWNILLMSLSVFPVFLLAERITENSKTSLAVTVLTMLAPDFLLGQLVMSETIIYPLFFTQMYLFYLFIRDGGIWRSCLIGILTGLLFFTKPGMVVPGILMLVSVSVCAVKSKDKKSFICVAVNAGAIIGVFVLFLLFMLPSVGIHTSVFSVYDAQIKVLPEKAEQFKKFFTAILSTPYYFAISCGILVFILPMIRCKSLSESNREILIIAMSSIILISVGTAWSVNRYEYQSSAIHTRYIAMFIPILLMLCFSPCTEINRHLKAYRITFGLLSVYFIFVVCLFGVRSGIDYSSSEIFNLSFAMFREVLIPQGSDWLWGISIFSAFVLSTWSVFTQDQKNQNKSAYLLLAAVVLLSNYAGYKKEYSLYNQSLKPASQALLASVNNESYIYVCNTDIQNDISLDSLSDKGSNLVPDWEFASALSENSGIYKPFVPTKQRGMVPLLKTGDVSLFVFDRDITKHTVFSPSAVVLDSDESSDLWTAVYIKQGERFIDNMITGIHDSVCLKGQTCYLWNFNAAETGRPYIVKLDIEFSDAGHFWVNGSPTVEVPEGRGTIDLESPEDGSIMISVRCDEADITIHSAEFVYKE